MTGIQLPAAAIGAVVGALVSAVVTGMYTLIAKRSEYINDYRKQVVTKRIAAYEQLETLIVSLKTTVLDTDNRPYHFLFSREDDWKSAYALILDIISHALWMSDEAVQKTQELNYRIFRLKPEGGVIEFGKTNYQAIAVLREDLERIVATDMLELHNVNRFLKAKKQRPSQDFIEVPLSR